MAGSLTWRTYTADNGDKFSVAISKSIASGTFTNYGSSFAFPKLLFERRDDNYPLLPRGFRMRMLNLRSGYPDLVPAKLNITVPCGNLTVIQELMIEYPFVNWLTGTYAIGGYYNVASYRGEFRKIDGGGLQFDG